MRVYLLDREKITKILLPNEIDGIFLMNYNPVGSKISKELCIEAKNNQWILKSNGSINVLNENNSILENCILNEQMHLKVNIVGREDILDLYCLPSVDPVKNRLGINISEITIGQKDGCSIIYSHPKVQEVHAGIYNQEGQWFLALPENNENCDVYLNDKIVKTRKKLKVGDILFIHGLKIIWMQSFIQINNPNNPVIINPLQLNNYSEIETDNTKYDAVSEEEQGIELYKPEDYFYHTPSLREYLEEEEVTIDAPPNKIETNNENFLMTFGASFTMTASAFVSGLNLINNINSGGKPLAIISSSVMCASMLVGSIIMPKLAKRYQKKANERKEKLRILKYTAYLDSRERYIKEIIAKQTQILKNLNIDIAEIVNSLNGNNNIWNREIKDEDFLTVRMGIGNVDAKLKISAPQDHFALEQDELLERIYKLENDSHILENVPVTFNFVENRVAALINDVPYGDSFLDSIIVQLASLHSAQELKLAFFINKNDSYDYDYVKYLPHIFSNDKTERYYAENYDEMKILSNNLESIFKERIDILKQETDKDKGKDINDNSTAYKRFDSYYILFVNDAIIHKNFNIFELICNNTENVGFSIIFIEKNINRLPKRCNSFIALSSEQGCVMKKDLNSQTQFAPEYIKNLDLKNIASKLFNIPLMPTEIDAALPKSLTFLEMFNVSKIEQLNISSRWKTNDPTMSLATPIGVHTSGETFTLDLHEKVAGPHGLIAGSTGSGKSEFIITFILSLAINYHPDEVQFVLIDYKGGGLAGAFENREKGTGIPHLAGTITNLDTSSMNRSLVSINSELKRREKMFSDARNDTGESTIDIYKYQKYYREGLVKEPISHLFIISDEFAELKAQQPEFMAELVSTARIGRSLGVHLILATQKPSGVVNEQIWSNSKFAICLKVQTTSDSQEMLKRPDAASLKEAGRFYLKVGFDEYFDIGQSGWSGAKYIPTDRLIKKVDDSLVFINNVGSVTKNINDLIKKDPSSKNEYGDQLTNIVKYLDELGKKEHYVPKKLWLDPIPEDVYLANLEQKYNWPTTPYEIYPLIGEYDNPKQQMQGALGVNLSKGNTYIFGRSGAGKEDLLNTLIYSVCSKHSPKEVIFYIVDMGAETLRAFIKYPQVADVCTADDSDKIIDLMVMMEKEINRRKDLTIDFGGNYHTYNELNNEKLPLINVIINNLDIFNENYAKIAELIIPLYRDGAKYGVTFTITATTIAAMRARTRDYFDNHISMQMPNADDYASILTNCPRKFTPANYKGRGLVEMNKEVYEFQTAKIYLKNETATIIRDTAQVLNQKYSDCKATPIPSIPKLVNVEGLIDFVDGLENIPLGYNAETKEKFFYNFKEHKSTVITALNLDNHLAFINALMLELKNVANLDIKVIDINSYFDILTLGLTLYQSDFNDTFGKVYEELSHLSKQTIYIFTGIGKLKESIDPDNAKFISNYFIEANKNNLINFIFIDTYENLNTLKMDDWYDKIVSPENGIWLGPDVGGQMLIKFKNLTNEDKQVQNPDFMFVCREGKRSIVKKVVVKEPDENEGEEE